MKRALVILAVLAGSSAIVLATTGAGGTNDSRHYTVELDTAFGLVTGADLKIAGVRAGKIQKLRLDRRTQHALVDFSVDKTGFGSLRTDTFCETRPQSLIGEYFIDCRPGTAPTELKDGATIPISQTASTIAPDLVGDLMRRPYRERFRILLSELGLGVGARADQLNDAIRRASPALRETDKVLKILGDQNQVIARLITDADTVLYDLAGNRKDVSRWVSETANTSAISAERQRDIAAGLHKLPAFLAELEPTMAELGRAADAQTPTLSDLNASAGQLQHFFTSLKPFTDSTRVNLRSLAAAAKQGDPAVKAAQPLVKELSNFSTNTPELANNLNIVLHDLDDRSRAIEKDPQSPGGQGFTGFEALMRYVFNQAMAINIYDAHGWMLKANVFVSECSDYQNAESYHEKIAADPDFEKRCGSRLGPYQPGLFQPDPTKPATQAKKKKTKKAGKDKQSEQPAAAVPTPDAQEKKPDVPKPVLPDVGQTIQNLLDNLPGGVKLPDVDTGLGGVVPDRTSQGALLDFLLAP